MRSVGPYPRTSGCEGRAHGHRDEERRSVSSHPQDEEEEAPIPHPEVRGEAEPRRTHIIATPLCSDERRSSTAPSCGTCRPGLGMRQGRLSASQDDECSCLLSHPDFHAPHLLILRCEAKPSLERRTSSPRLRARTPTKHSPVFRDVPTRPRDEARAPLQFRMRNAAASSSP